jgi:A/G-specific adenine glycosylase
LQQLQSNMRGNGQYENSTGFLHDFDIATFRIDLLSWWQLNRRKFPWREVRDPYKVLIAEILLHRTRADQVVPVYRDFIEQFPAINFIARASVDELMEIMKPLGLYWRVELLREMAQQLISRFDGSIPQEKKALESLPGISHYIASALRCFAYGYADALLDTNTVRICGRLLSIPVTDGSRRSKKFREIIETLVDPDRPHEFNYALIDHGALVCRSRNPICVDCSVRRQCSFGARG